MRSILLAFLMATTARAEIPNRENEAFDPPGTSLPVLAHETRWVSLAPPEVWHPVLDTRRNQLLLLPYEPYRAPGEFWSLSLQQGSSWRKEFWDNSGPAYDDVRSVVYDRESDRVLVLTGDFLHASPISVWAVSLTGRREWTVLPATSGAPTDREAFAFIHDTRRNRYVLFGGEGYGSISMRNDVWSLEVKGGFVTWLPLQTTGDSVAAHSNIGAVYDEKRDRMIVFGGTRGVAGGGAIDGSDDLPTLEFGEPSRWRVAKGTTPYSGIYYQPQCVVDPRGDRMLVFGGAASEPVAIPLGDLTQSVPFSSQRLDGSALVDLLSDNQAIAVNYGHEVDGFSPSQFSGYERISPPKDMIVRGDGFTLGPSFAQGRDGSVLYWGGFLAGRPGSERELWRFDPAHEPHWSVTQLESDVPSARVDAALAYDGRHHRWLLFGGINPPYTRLGDLWAFYPLEAKWKRIELPTHGGPGPLQGAAAAYDGMRDRLVLFGGRSDVTPVADTWSLNLSGTPRWDLLGSPGRQPGKRGNATLVWDPTKDRMILFGGADRWDSVVGVAERPWRDTWALPLESGAVWDSLPASPSAPRPTGQEIGWFDPARREVDAVGGTGQSPTVNPPPYAWNWLRGFELAGAPSWGNPPDGTWTPGSRAPGVDLERDRVLVFSGVSLSEAFVLERGSPTHVAYLDLEARGSSNGRSAPVTLAILGDPLFDVSTLDPASVVFAGTHAQVEQRNEHASIKDVNGDGLPDRLLRFDSGDLPEDRVLRLDGRTTTGLAVVGFTNLSGSRIDRSTIRLAGDPDSPHDTVRAFAISVSGFDRGAGVLHLDLPEPSRVQVDVFAVNGRRVAQRDLGELAAGSHDVGAVGLMDAGAGIYFVQARAGAAVAQTRFILLP